MPDKSHIRRSWDNMRHRVAGIIHDGCGNPRWQGLEVGWGTFAEFKAWAMRSGYEVGLSLDRIDGSRGYVPDNCQWITVKQNNEKARNSHTAMCACWWCVKRRKQKENACASTA